MKKILLITALLALVSVNALAESNHSRHRGWFDWFPRWERNHREHCPRPEPVNVPDGGATATLLGLSCAGLALAKRKMRP